MKNLLSLLAGALLVAGFAPLSCWPIALLAPCLLLHSLYLASPRQAAWRFFIFGVGFFGVGVSWLYVSIHVYGQTPALVAAFFTLGFIAFLAALLAPFAYLVHRFSPRQNAVHYLFAWPVAWIAAEALRATIFTGFPWLLLGVAHTHSPLGHTAPLAGVYAVGLLSMVISGGVYYTVRCKQWRMLLVGTLITGLFCLATANIPWTPPTDNLSVALLQGNIPQNMRWQEQKEHVRLYHGLIEKSWDADIVLLPEAAFEIPRPYINPLLTVLSAQAKETDTALLIGVPTDLESSYQNTLIALGTTNGVYAKQHLVPFGEYVPWEGLLRGVINFLDLPMSDFSPGHESVVFNSPKARLLPTICYEIAFPGLWQDRLNESDIIVSVVNNAWFGDSLAPHQQWQMAQFAAKAAGKPLIQASNTGTTGAINAQGQPLASLPLFQEDILFTSITKVEGHTLWAYTGQKGIGLIVILMLLIVMRSNKHRRV